MKLKNISIAILAGILVFGLSACSSSGSASSAPAAASSAAPSSTESSAPAASSAAAASSEAAGSIPKPEGSDTTVSIGVTPVPHEEIVKDVVKPALEKAGWIVKIVEFNDYVQPNTSLESGDIDANYFQTTRYLQEENAKRSLHLVSVAEIHLEPMGLYSKKVKAVSALKDGSSIGIPNDGSNESRALRLLADNNLIKVDNADLLTVENVTSNPHNFKFVEVDAANLVRTLDDVDAAVINGNYALEAKFNPATDALIRESSDTAASKPYFNDLVVKKGNENTAKTNALKEALTSQSVKDYITKTYKGSVIPAF